MATAETSRPAAAPLVAGLSPRTWKMLGIAASLVGACVLPFWITNFHLSQMTLVLVYAIALLGLNMLTGFNGQISLGHGAFYAIGGYTTAILLVKFSGVEAPHTPASCCRGITPWRKRSMSSSARRS